MSRNKREGYYAGRFMGRAFRSRFISGLRLGVNSVFDESLKYYLIHSSGFEDMPTPYFYRKVGSLAYSDFKVV